MLNLNIKGEVRAKTNCEYYSLNIEDLSEKKLIKIFDLFKNQICNFELIFLFKLLLNQTNLKELLLNKNYLFNDLKKIFNISQDISEIRKTDKIIYLDKAYSGFKYGQYINGEIYKQFFSENQRRISIVKLDEGSYLSDINIQDKIIKNNIEKIDEFNKKKHH